MKTKTGNMVESSHSGSVPRIVRPWCAKNVAIHHDTASVHTVGVVPHCRAKWTSVDYTLPDGRSGVWWQPHRPVRYKAFDFMMTRARDRLARVYKQNDLAHTQKGRERGPDNTQD